jgi:RND family efflux transporter MFP subunit
MLTRMEEPLQRIRRLYEAKAVSKQDLDQIEIPHLRAKVERDAAQAVIGKVNGELQVAYSKLGETRIHAPFDGFVVRRLADEGEAARAFPPTVVLVITRHDPLMVQAEVVEEEVPRLTLGQKVDVTCDAVPSAAPIPGVLEEIIPYVNPMTRTATVRVKVSNRDGRLMPGMTARIRAVLAPQRLVAVPQAALATEPLDSRVSVFVVEGGKLARERKIRFGRMQGPWVSVLEGLRPGEAVVVKGHERLLDRSTVKATPAAPARPTSPGSGHE